MTLREQFMIVGIQLIYAAIFFILIFNLRHDRLSLDHFLGRRAEVCLWRLADIRRAFNGQRQLELHRGTPSAPKKAV